MFVIPNEGRNLLSGGASEALVDAAKSRFLATLGMTRLQRIKMIQSRERVES